MTGIDSLWAIVRSGDAMAFADWAGRVERPVRASLHRFARAVDLEVVMQETLLRMWLMAKSADRELEGDNASLRMALAIARNVAREEVRRARLDRLIPLEDLDDASAPRVEPDPVSDPGLARAIRDCVGGIRDLHRTALLARVERGFALSDLDLARELGLKLNTFHQHILRARRSLADCLKGKDVDLAGVWP